MSGVRNTMSDLHNVLFEEIERLNDESIKGEELSQEIDRANAIGKIAETILDGGNLALQVARFKDEAASLNPSIPRYLES